jgi:hypothetical protein
LKMKHLIATSACLAFLATTALAQTIPQPPAIGVIAPNAGGQQADIRGTVKAFKMTPVGDLEGIILTDGTEVHLPPHLSSQLAAPAATRRGATSTASRSAAIAAALTSRPTRTPA